MPAMPFGMFDHVDRGGEPLGMLYENRLRLVAAAEAAGFRTYHVAEHHATRLGMAPSPSVFLAAVAQRTKRIRFGPLVYLLPLHPPLRLIEEICMLDHMSGGRFELGVGRGISPYELAYCGVDFLEAHEIYVGRFVYGDLGYERASRSLELFAREVIPHFRTAGTSRACPNRC